MRPQFNEIIEKGRVTIGPYASEVAERQGAFFLKCPTTGAQLKVLVSDGTDWAESGLPGEPWEHVSVSLSNRCPSWEEMAWVKSLFFNECDCVVQFHPPVSQYVNHHPNCLHLWRPTSDAVPMPPLECV